MGLEFVAFGDLSRGWGFVKGCHAEGAAAGDGRRATGDENPPGRSILWREASRGRSAFSPSPAASRLEKQKTAKLSLAVFWFSTLNTLTENFSFSLLRYRK